MNTQNSGSSSSSSPAPPPASGHPLQYEILHRNEVKLRSAREQLLASNQSNHNDAQEKIRHFNVQTMFHRSALGCLIHSAQEVARRDGKEEDVVALESLWVSRSRELEEDLHMPNYVGCSPQALKQTGFSEQCEILDAPDDLADLFFEMYPEAARHDDDLEYSSSDESVQEVKPKKTKKGTKDEPICVSGEDSPSARRAMAGNGDLKSHEKNQSASNPRDMSNGRADSKSCNISQPANVSRPPSNETTYNGRNHMAGNPNNHQSHSHQQSHQFQLNHQNHYNQQQKNQDNQQQKNPYSQNQHRQQQPQQQPPAQQQYNQWQDRPSTGQFDYNESSNINQNNSFNQNQSRTENPFLSAKEVGNKLNSNDDWDDYENTGNGNWYNNPRNGRNNGRNGWGNDKEVQFRGNNMGNNRTAANNASRPQQMVQTALRGPNKGISEGLQKKYQNPKMGASNNANNGGGQTNKPSNRNNNAKDDEELPEELRGLDKELIERIENDIVDNGEKVTFDDIAGLANAKDTVREMIIMPMLNPQLFTGLRAAPNGLLLFGPPGTGKTLIGKAIAHESGATFFSISSSTLTSKWIGEGEKMVRTLFAVARYRSPAVVFIDEVDSLLTMRKSDENEASRRIKTEFLVQLDGAGNRKEGSHVLMVGATNRPQELDDAARRRFVKRLYVPLPADTDRETLLRNLLAKNRHSLTDKEIIKLSKATDGFSGADLKNLCTDAAMGPIRQLGRDAMNVNVDQLPPITYKHFRSSLKSTSPSVAQADLDVYLEWNQTYGTKATGGEDSESDDGSSDDEDAT